MLVSVFKEFFDAILGVDLPSWFYNSFAILVSLSIMLSLLQLAFPKLSKYTRISIIAITIGYLAYEILPVWGIGKI